MKFYFVLWLLVAITSQAQAYSTRSDVDIDIIDSGGNTYPTYNRSRNRYYLEAEQGENYAIRIHNQGNRRIGIVIAVDGRNIISGKKSTLSNHERMYVIDSGRQATYNGWRVNDRKIHRFYFTNSRDSYAGQFDDYSAMGVIAVAVYQEKRQVVYDNWDRDQILSRSPKKSTRFSEEAAGTGFGQEQDSRVRKVNFEPESSATKTYYKYEWRSTLCRKGIISCDHPQDNCRKNRFWPGDCSQDDYAPYPPQYRYHR